MVQLNNMFENEHPFAQYVRTLGKGKSGSRNLTREESEQAMHMILNGEVEDLQLGAFLMLMRHQEESGEELAGFVDATRRFIKIPENMPQIDIDWSSYAGKSRRLPWFILSNLLLAEQGYNILIHGAAGHTPGRIYTEEVFKHFKLPVADSLQQAAQLIEKHHFAYLPLANFLPKLDEIINFKPLLGLRSPVNTFTRLINPCMSACSMQGIHHPGYKDYHQDASILLEQPRMAVLKGDGGETEWNPDMSNLVRYVIQGKASEEEWQPIYEKRHVKDSELNIEKLNQVWSGTLEDEYAMGAIIGTTAITLYTMGKTNSHQESLSLARSYWESRNKSLISGFSA